MVGRDEGFFAVQNRRGRGVAVVEMAHVKALEVPHEGTGEGRVRLALEIRASAARHAAWET
jgi:hypothetical protein